MLGGGGVVNAVGSIATKILSYFADDPKQQIDRFVDIFGSLAKAKDTIDDGVSVLEKINKIDVTSNISSIIENIAIAFSSNWFSKDLGDVKEDLLVKFFHLFDVIKEKGGGVAAAADILNQIARINVSRSIGETIQTLSNSFTTNWFSKDLGDVDETLIKKFFHIFDVLGKASSGVSAGAYVLDTISKLDVSKKIPDNLAALADVFSTHWFSKDITDIDTDVIEKFFVNFAILGASKNSVESGAKVLKLIADMDIGNNIQNNIQMLAKLFSDSAWYKSANAADIKEDVLEKFFKIFDLLKENRARIEAGAPTLRLFHDIGVTSADSEGIAAIANMFSYHSTVKDLSNVNLDYIDVLGEIFSRIGKRTNDIINGAGAMAALGTIDLSDSKIKGIASLTNLFTSGYIEGLNKVELNLVDVLGNIFQKFSDRKSSFESGADVLYQLGGLEFTDEKMKGLALFGGMFSKGTSALGKAWAAVTGGDSTANINAIDTLAVIFGKFGENTVSFINGAGALAALNTINVDGDKLTNLFSLISDKMFPEDFDPTSVLGRIDGMMKIFDKFAKNQAIIVQAVDSINTIGNIDTTSLQVLQNLFSTIPGSSNTSAANVGLPTANITNIDKTTSDYYEKTTMQFNRMIELLELAHADAIDLKRIETDGLKDITDAVKSTSGRIF
jgi:hypothetical protein